MRFAAAASSRRRMRCRCSAPRFSARPRSLLRSSSERCGTGKKSFQQSAKIESGASADDGQVSSRLAFAQSYLAQNLPRLARIFSRANVGERIHAIQQMMRNFRALRRTRLGRADVKFAVHRNRVAVDDFSVEAPRDRQRQSRLAARRRAQHDHDQGLAIHSIYFGKLATFRAFGDFSGSFWHLQRALQGMYRQ